MSEEKIDLDKLVKIYITIRDKKEELTNSYKEEVAKLDEKMDVIKSKLDDIFESGHMDSISTKSGTAYRKVETTYTINDWEGLYEFIEDNKLPQVLQKRLNQGVLKEWLESNPTIVPRGLNSFSKHKITVRRKS